MIKRTFIDKVRSDGYNTIAISFLASLFSFYYSYYLGLCGLLFTAFCIWFFRDPDRVVPNRSDIVISPADGIVVDIERNVSSPEFKDGSWTRIGIFLRLSDVHVNRFPISGKIMHMKYEKGGFGFAWGKKTHMKNERLAIFIKGFIDCIVVQIAGFVARRIVTDVSTKDDAKMGSTYGMIKFGSRVDTYFPGDMIIHIKRKQTVVAGETIIASKPKITKESNEK
ncbi:phosphatidylserine decarboxylase [Candidatus Cytomitobacter indipagum]|uniref:Phosphatidylserine decarboxylase proenzyme n=1 Tax=Candidatus Cytomitobacter indipagum TaxID=2601575 RepID=A0A5C0UEF2_9PROT|nr:phosphatidylserine decarboxylase [Candidatus Cytomitobacter indipagum]QEK38061.1 phosphatidylserine decarboxylase [Candidatus Cytomitobacter indipagum]